MLRRLVHGRRARSSPLRQPVHARRSSTAMPPVTQRINVRITPPIVSGRKAAQSGARSCRQRVVVGHPLVSVSSGAGPCYDPISDHARKVVKV